MHIRRAFVTAALILTASGILEPTQVIAAPQDAPPAPQSTTPSGAGENNGQDFTRPEDLFQVRYLYQTAPGSGTAPGTFRSVTTDIVALRTDFRVDLASQWALAFRADLPLTAKNSLSPDNPFGNYDYGVGDADFQVALLHTFDARWAAGIGARLVAPTGASDLTSGKWQTVPVAGVRYMLPELSTGSYVSALIRYDVSVAGDPTKKNISNLQFEPTLNISLPDRWFLTFYPSSDIRWNYGDPITGQTGRLFLPLDIMIGRNLAHDTVMSLEVGMPIIKDYPVYNFKTQMRLNVKF